MTGRNGARTNIFVRLRHPVGNPTRLVARSTARAQRWHLTEPIYSVRLACRRLPVMRTQIGRQLVRATIAKSALP
jgi:hypothetical protein